MLGAARGLEPVEGDFSSGDDVLADLGLRDVLTGASSGVEHGLERDEGCFGSSPGDYGGE